MERTHALITHRPTRIHMNSHSIIYMHVRGPPLKTLGYKEL